MNDLFIDLYYSKKMIKLNILDESFDHFLQKNKLDKAFLPVISSKYLVFKEDRN